ncbi:uncharacterized protein LOC143276023 [Babylonia areolata]|uniref:uncharacterized protein LOC143276023 n=1 Tax=Babylonia areolata TaxID=304850 RepID=UPI003FD4250F
MMDSGPSDCPLQTLRPHKLRRFSGDEGAEEFIREATLMLQLQPMTDSTAAGWIISALEGRARQEVLSMEAGDVDTQTKIFSILEQHWGEQRDSSTLAGVFFRRQQGLAESVGEYATALRILWTKTNAASSAASSDTFSPVMLRNTFVNGLHPPSLRRDLKRFLRERPDITFADVAKEAQRWMREDGVLDAAVEQPLPLIPVPFTVSKSVLRPSPQRQPP